MYSETRAAFASLRHLSGWMEEVLPERNILCVMSSFMQCALAKTQRCGSMLRGRDAELRPNKLFANCKVYVRTGNYFGPRARPVPARGKDQGRQNSCGGRCEIDGRGSRFDRENSRGTREARRAHRETLKSPASTGADDRGNIAEP